MMAIIEIRNVPNGLRRARKVAGFTQREVARKLGICGTDRISRWEKGTSTPNITNLFKLCLLYKVLPHELYLDYFSELHRELEALVEDEFRHESYVNPDHEFS